MQRFCFIICDGKEEKKSNIWLLWIFVVLLHLEVYDDRSLLYRNYEYLQSQLRLLPDAHVKDEHVKKQLFCKALIKQIGVLADGSLVPCCLDHDGDVVLGNLLRQSLDEILSSPRAQALIEGFKHHAATEALCQNCESALARNSFRGKTRKQID